MKAVKLFALALAMLMAVALTGASSAAANPTALCKVNVLVCTEVYPVGTHIHARSVGSPLLLTDLVTVHCKLSHLLAHIAGSAALANPLLIAILELLFQNCQTSAGLSCEVAVEQLGHLLLLKTAPNLGTLQSHGFSFGLACPGIVQCTFGGLPTLHAEGQNGTRNAHITAEEVELERQGGLLCPEEAFLDTLYEVTLPAPLYITL